MKKFHKMDKPTKKKKKSKHTHTHTHTEFPTHSKFQESQSWFLQYPTATKSYFNCLLWEDMGTEEVGGVVIVEGTFG